MTWRDPKKALEREEWKGSRSDTWMVMKTDLMMDKLRVLLMGRKLDQTMDVLMENTLDIQKV